MQTLGIVSRPTRPPAPPPCAAGTPACCPVSAPLAGRPAQCARPAAHTRPPPRPPIPPQDITLNISTDALIAANDLTLRVVPSALQFSDNGRTILMPYYVAACDVGIARRRLLVPAVPVCFRAPGAGGIVSGLRARA